MNELEIFKKKLIYRSNYRGSKEMDILLSEFVRKHIDKFNESQLNELDEFLNFEDDVILNYYQRGIIEKNIDKNKISEIFRNYFV